MKTRFTRILGVGLTLMLLASLMVFAAPSSAGTMSMSAETIPSATDKIITTGNSTSDMAVSADGMTIYAAMGAAQILYKSTNAGESWVELSNVIGTTSFPAKNVDMVAVAPDDADVVAIGCNDYTVYYSTNGGSSWSGPVGNLANMQRVWDIDISAPASGYHYLAAAGDNTTNGADLWVLKLAVGKNWDRRANVVSKNSTAAQTTARAVKFSPNFGTDKIVTVVTGNSTDAYFQIYSEDSKLWNAAVTGYDDYKTGAVFGIDIDTINFPTVASQGVVKADIALAPDYDGTEDVTRVAYVAVATANATLTQGGVARLIDNNQDKEIKTWTNASLGGISSVDYDGEKVIAGDYDNNRVYRCLSPLVTSPKCERLNTYKQPGGTGNVTVAWAGDKAVAATGGNNSAFAVSDDDAYSFVDMSLLNTAMTNIQDVAVSADGSKVYMVTDNGTFTSVWRKASAWVRVFTTQDQPFIIRVAPEDADAVYIAKVGAADVYFSSDSGQTVWKKRPSTKVTVIVDMAVQSKDVAHVISTTKISKTSNSAASWATAKALNVSANAHMMSLAPNNDILIGTVGGRVAWSTDGGATFEETDQVVGAAANTVVIADDDYVENNILYASNKANNDVYRGKATKNTTWSNKGSTGGGQLVRDLAMYDGILYVVSDNAGAGAAANLMRTFNPTAETPTWSAVRAEAGDTFNRAPSALRISKSDSTVKLWAVETTAAPDELHSMKDVLALNGPTLNSPADKYSLPVNPENGWGYSVTLSFDRPNEKATLAQVQVATDEAFRALLISDSTVTTTGSNPTRGYVVAQQLMPGETYYWRVRVAQNGPWYSPWSEKRTIVVGELPARIVESKTPPVEVTPAPAPEVNVEAAPAPQVTVDVPPYPEPVPAIPAAMLWAIIAIGAVLIIAVIVLIVRTRRVV